MTKVSKLYRSLSRVSAVLGVAGGGRGPVVGAGPDLGDAWPAPRPRRRSRRRVVLGDVDGSEAGPGRRRCRRRASGSSLVIVTATVIGRSSRVDSVEDSGSAMLRSITSRTKSLGTAITQVVSSSPMGRMMRQPGGVLTGDRRCQFGRGPRTRSPQNLRTDPSLLASPRALQLSRPAAVRRAGHTRSAHTVVHIVCAQGWTTRAVERGRLGR